MESHLGDAGRAGGGARQAADRAGARHRLLQVDQRHLRPRCRRRRAARIRAAHQEVDPRHRSRLPLRRRGVRHRHAGDRHGGRDAWWPSGCAGAIAARAVPDRAGHAAPSRSRSRSGSPRIGGAGDTAAAMLRSATSTSWRQRAEWNIGPSNDSMPGNAGVFGMWSAPTAETRIRASIRSEPLTSTCQREEVYAASPSHAKYLAMYRALEDEHKCDSCHKPGVDKKTKGHALNDLRPGRRQRTSSTATSTRPTSSARTTQKKPPGPKSCSPKLWKRLTPRKTPTARHSAS